MGKRRIGFGLLLGVLAADAARAGRIVAPPARSQRVAGLNRLAPALDLHVEGGLAVGATCVNFAPAWEGGPTGGLLDLTGVPPRAGIVRALLYWTVISPDRPVPSGAPTLDGAPLAPELVAELEGTPCFSSQRYTAAFRADVTALEPRNGEHLLAGFVSSGVEDGVVTEGATLFVVHSTPGCSPADIVIVEGLDLVNDTTDVVLRQELAGFAAPPTGPVRATLALAAGNGQRAAGDPNPILFNGVDLHAGRPAIMSGALCPPAGLYDRTVLDVTGLVAPLDESATLEIRFSADCYTLAAVALAVAASPGPTLREPSALDVRSGSTPLLVARLSGRLLLTWEDVGPASYEVWQGRIGEWYSHAPAECALATTVASVPEPSIDTYFLVVAVGCEGMSSAGRDSFGRERPTALEATGSACP